MHLRVGSVPLPKERVGQVRGLGGHLDDPANRFLVQRITRSVVGETEAERLDVPCIRDALES